MTECSAHLWTGPARRGRSFAASERDLLPQMDDLVTPKALDCTQTSERDVILVILGDTSMS